jgi:hypothetical protein
MNLLSRAAEIRNHHHHQKRIQQRHPPTSTASTNSALPSTIHLRGNATRNHRHREVWLDVYDYAQASLTPSHPSKRNYSSTSASVLLDSFPHDELDDDDNERHPYEQKDLHEPSVDNVIARKLSTINTNVTTNTTTYFSKRNKSNGVKKITATTPSNTTITFERKQRPQSAVSLRRESTNPNSAPNLTSNQTTTARGRATNRSGSRTARSSFSIAARNINTNTKTTIKGSSNIHEKKNTNNATTSTTNGRNVYLTSRGERSNNNNTISRNNNKNDIRILKEQQSSRRNITQRPNSARTSTVKLRKKGCNNNDDVVSVVELSFANGNHYQGEWCNGKPSGFGTYKWKDGSEYCGQFVKGEFHGRGSKKWTTGKKYSGDWEHSLYSGHGELIFPDNSKYVGSFKEGLFHGHGRRKWPNKDVYDGEWINGKREGIGKLIRDKDAHFVYEGNWFNGKMHGSGRAEWDGSGNDHATRTCYDGQWNNGLRHGQGTLTTLNSKDKSIVGVVVKGTFVRGRICGKATLLYPQGDKYIGLVENGQPNGEGIMYWIKDKSSFEGEFVSGKPCGKGTYRDSKGELSGCFGIAGVSGPGSKMWKIHRSEVVGICGKTSKIKNIPGEKEEDLVEMKYVGQLLDDKMHGPGTLCWPDGRVYSGHFVQDQIEGQGTMRWKETSNNNDDVDLENTYIGRFESGRFEGQGELIFSDGASYKGLFKDGLFHGKGDFMGYLSEEKEEHKQVDNQVNDVKRMRISGVWRHGKPDGVVEIDFDALHGGGTYRGEVTRGMFNGKGTRVWPNGNIYIGQWETSGSSSSNSRNRSGSSSGIHKGLIMHADDRGTMHGRGSYLYSNGCQYVGEFEYGVRSGSGKQIWSSGHFYVGDWKHDAPHGCGMFVDSTSGVNLSGQWNHGRLIREIVEQIVPPPSSSKKSKQEKSFKKVIVGVKPFPYHEVHVGVQSEDDDLLLLRQKKLKCLEKMKKSQIQIRLDGSLYIGATWRGVNHGDGIHVSSECKERNGPWTMGCSSETKFIKHEDQHIVEEENQKLIIQKDDLRNKVKKMMVPRQ